MDADTQQRIVRGLQQGSRQALLSLHDVYAERVWREIARLLGADSVTVADLVQETFLAVMRSARDFDPRRGSLWVWLSAIARQQVALHYRKRAREDEFRRAVEWWASLNHAAGRWLSGEEPAPTEVLESREMSLLVRSALAQLRPDYQTLLVFKYMDGASVADLARELRTTDTAVRSKLARARRAFKTTFERAARRPRQ